MTPNPPPETRQAAFYDVDGTLVSTNVVHAFAFYARNQPTLWRSLRKSAGIVASIPLFLGADKISRKMFNELFYGYYKGESEDRLLVLSEELFDKVIRPSIFPRTFDLFEQARQSGLRNVLLTGGLDFTMRPLARFLGADDLIANRLEFDKGYATGKLKKPFVGGVNKAEIMRDYARRHNIDLGSCWAYSDSYSDYAMLAVVGHPTAVNPDFRLSAVARSYDWPVLHLA